jgi:hypothetical protein
LRLFNKKIVWNSTHAHGTSAVMGGLITTAIDLMAVGRDYHCVIDLDWPVGNRKIERILRAFGP